MAEYSVVQPQALNVLPWYSKAWVTMAAMYVFLPAGLYHMWRYRDWPVWFKWLNTVVGPVVAIVSTYISSRYIWPRIL